MRKPPDQRRKTPPRCADAEGSNRKKIARKEPKRVKTQNQRLEYLPGTPSTHAVAKRLLNDGLAPVRVRTFAAQADHRLRVGGWVTADEEQYLRRFDTARQQTLAALLRMYR